EPAARQVEAVGDAPEAAPAAQVPHVSPHAQRDVHRCDAAEARPPGMRDAISAWPSRAFSPAAVLAEMQLHLVQHDFRSKSSSRFLGKEKNATLSAHSRQAPAAV